MEKSEFTNLHAPGASAHLHSIRTRGPYPLSYLDRRQFLRVAALGTAGATLSFTPGLFVDKKVTYEDWDPGKPFVIQGKELRVQPVFMYHLRERREQTSWRPWGSIYTEQGATEEIQRINRELSGLSARSDFPLKILPVKKVLSQDQAASINSNDHDVVLIYAASGAGQLFRACTRGNKDTIVFVRHQSGPLYQWHQVLNTAFLNTGKADQAGGNTGNNQVHVEDVVVDDYMELLWRLRALYGVRNFLGTRIVALGGAMGKYSPEAPQVARDTFKMDIIEVSYESVENRIVNALADKKLVSQAEKLTDRYLALPNTTLVTDRKFVTNAFLLYFLFKNLMHENDATAFTIRGCMQTIIPMSRTTACLSLSLLMDEGYLAFCESDFVIIPPAVLLGHISGKPAFFLNSTFPHKGMVHCAHCAAPRRMDGIHYDPVKIVTHYESDYGAAPKVTLPIGQEVTFFNPEYSTNRWLGYKGNIRDNPHCDSCTSQQIVQIQGKWEKLKNEARDSHWVMAFGDYLREGEYASRRIGVNWENLL
jgi:hypothetical protein